MGTGEKFRLGFLHRSQQQQRKSNNNQVVRDVPKGCLAIKVGKLGEEEKRFVVPVVYFNHPMFLKLLKEAEEEYGFDQKGTITIPCGVEDFLYVQGRIIKEQNHQNLHVRCFRP